MREAQMRDTLRTIYLIRHAETVWNSERRVQGTYRDVPLSETGRRQAELLGARLRTLSFEHVYSSPAVRALETARIALGDGHPITVADALHELSLGVWEGRLISEINEENPGAIDSWYRDPTAVRVEGMEEMPKFRERSVSVMREIIESTGQGNVVVVTHGGIICTYLTSILNMSLTDLWGFSLPNASITAVVLDFRPRLRSFGDIAHLDGDSIR
jgi:broad specificity phosphatase PhoE